MNALTRWDPTRPLSQFRQEVDELMRGFFGPTNGDKFPATMPVFVPAVDISETKDSYTVKVEVPGLESKDIDVKVENDVLTIQGEKKSEKEEKNRNFHLVERTYGAFHRSFTLPSTVKADAIKATCKSGVLELLLPKTEEARMRSIKVDVKS